MEDNEMDGGTTMVAGKRMRIILDEKGVFKRTEELSGAAAKADKASPAMEDAISRAVQQGIAEGLKQAQAAQPQPAPAQGSQGTGFQAPT